MNSWRKRAVRVSTGIAVLTTALALTGPGSAIADAGSVEGSLDAGSSAIDWAGDLVGVDLGSSELGRTVNPIIGDLGSSGNDQGGAPTRQACNAATKSGGAGVTTTSYNMGRRGPMTFRLNYETYNVPDRIVVNYQGRVVADTGYVGDNINEGTGSILVRTPAGAADTVTVQVTGPQGTEWDYTVYCPN